MRVMGCDSEVCSNHSTGKWYNDPLECGAVSFKVQSNSWLYAFEACFVCFHTYFLCREGFRQERLKLTEEIERVQNELELVQVSLRKEIEYKETVEQSHHSLLLEQQDLHIKLVHFMITKYVLEIVFVSWDAQKLKYAFQLRLLLKQDF